MSIIKEDLPDYTFTRGWSGTCGDQSFEIPSGERIDDLRIYVVNYEQIGGGAAWGGPRVVRAHSHLPVVGCMSLYAGANLGVSLHEIGHVLGFGTIWNDFGFRQDYPGDDPHFNGPLAIAAFNAAGGRATRVRRCRCRDRQKVPGRGGRTGGGLCSKANS